MEERIEKQGQMIHDIKRMALELGYSELEASKYIDRFNDLFEEMEDK